MALLVKQTRSLTPHSLLIPADYWRFWKQFKHHRADNNHIDLDIFTCHYQRQGGNGIHTRDNENRAFMESLSTVVDNDDLGEYSYFYGADLDIDIINDILNGPITRDELYVALKRAKNKKACGSDGIPAEIFKYSDGILQDAVLALFNYIFDSGIYPDAWSTGTINPIYKQKEKGLPENYRKITLLPAISKIFETTLNNRLRHCKSALCTDDPLQNGFKTDARAIDNTFVLSGIIEKYKALERPLYVAFIDFKSAFDHVNRKALLFKLKSQKVHGKFLNIVRSMLQNSKSRVKWNGTLGEIFDNLNGVLQGGVLSPSLFRIFMEDLPNYLDKRKGVTIGGMLISYLLHADDLVLVSETSAGLQALLDGLNAFCKRWDMLINTTKTNIMIFNKSYICTREICEFVINEEIVHETKIYKYLGTMLSNKKNIFEENFAYLKGKALRAIGAMRSDIRRAVGSALPLHLYLKSFDTQIRPILEYGAEIWYNPKPIRELESVHLSYLKTILGVRQQTPTLAVLGETGRFPLHLRQQDQVLKYWKRLQKLDKGSVLYNVYTDLVDLDLLGHTTWVTRARTILEYENVDEHILDLPPASPLPIPQNGPRYRKFIADWMLQINDSEMNPKLRTYKTFKLSFQYEPNLKCLTIRNYLTALVRFRTSSHNLATEKGHHCRPALPIPQRTCEFCPNSPIDDEVHMLLHCTYHDKERECMMAVISCHLPLILEERGLFRAIMSHTHPDVLHALGKFLNTGFKKRDDTTDAQKI